MLYSLFDFFIACTSANMWFYCFLNFFDCGIWIFLQKYFCTNYKSGRTETTLYSSFINKCLGNSIFYIFRKALGCENFGSFECFHFLNTSKFCLSIYLNCTCATNCLAGTSVFCRGNMFVETQVV